MLHLTRIRRNALALAVVLLVAVSAADTALAVTNLKVGDPMPQFTLPRSDGREGTFGTEKLKGRPSAIVFWRGDQKFALDALRDVQAAVMAVGSDRVNVVAVATQQSTTEAARQTLAKVPFSLPSVIDPGRALYGAVGVIVSPTLLLFDATGVLRFVSPHYPQNYRKTLVLRFRFLLGEITEEEMKQELAPTELGIEEGVASAWRAYNIGRKLEASGQITEAALQYERAITKHPRLTEARCALGFLRMRDGDLDKAREQFLSALAVRPDSPIARLGSAAVLARTDGADQAEKILTSLLDQKSEEVRVRYELGLIHRARGDTEQAMSYFHDALSRVFPEKER